MAKQRTGHSLVSGPAQPDQAQHFVRLQGKAGRADIATAHVLDRQQRRGGRRAQLNNLAQFAAHDQMHQFLGGGVSGVADAHHHAIAQHGNPVGNLEYFIKAVRDIDHPHALVAQAAQGDEQPLNLVRRQGCGGFVQHQKIAVHGKGAGNRDQ